MVDLDNRVEETITPQPSENGMVDFVFKSDMNDRSYFVSEVIDYSFTSEYPSIAAKQFTGGVRSVIRGTRIPVSVIIGYLLLGEKPEDIVKDILPNITLMQIDDAIRFYYQCKDIIDSEINENLEETEKLSYKSRWIFTGS